MRLRNTYPENKHDEIRETIPFVAHDWFYGYGTTVEQQFVSGTQALNEAFLEFVTTTRMFMPLPPDILPSYSTEIMDPYAPNQRFQNVANDMFYESQKMDFNVRKSPLFNGINKELDEATIGGVPLRGNLLETQISALATEISRNRDRMPKSHRLTWGVKRQCNDNFTSCEHPALPRKKFTLPRDYYTSAPQAEYWTGVEPCSSQLKKFTEYSAGGLAGRHPTDDNCGNPRISEWYVENVYKYPNYAAYRKDYIPSVRPSGYAGVAIAGMIHQK